MRSQEALQGGQRRERERVRLKMEVLEGGEEDPAGVGIGV
jgi:hypothetical protein